MARRRAQHFGEGTALQDRDLAPLPAPFRAVPGIALVTLHLVLWVVKCFCEGYESRIIRPFVIWEIERG